MMAKFSISASVETMSCLLIERKEQKFQNCLVHLIPDTRQQNDIDSRTTFTKPIYFISLYTELNDVSFNQKTCAYDIVISAIP